MNLDRARDALHYCRIVLSNRRPSTESVYEALQRIQLALEPDRIYDPNDPWHSSTIPNPKLAKQPPPECKTEAEKTAFAFGWFKALETQRAEQPAQQQEPVAWVETREDGSIYWGCETDTVISDDPSWLDRPVPVYFGSPASKPWVGLTDDEVNELQSGLSANHRDVRAIEAQLREKNA